MSVADVGAIDEALVTTLAGDAALGALLPDGVYLDVAPAGKTRFVIVQHQTTAETEGFQETLYEECRYAVTARVLAASGIDVNAAARRIHELLKDATLPIAGYVHSSTLRVERVKFTEVDAIDNDIRWQIAGGDYELFVSPTTGPTPPYTPTFDGRAFDTT